MLYQRLGQILVESGAITREQLHTAQALQARTQEELPQILFRRGDTTPAAVSALLQQQLGIGFSDLENEAFAPEAARLLPLSLARKYRVVPIRAAGNALLLAMADPLELGAADAAVLAAGMSVRPMLASPGAIDRAISRLYGAASAEQALQELRSRTENPEAPNPPPEEAAPAIRLVSGILEYAVSVNASDVHLEPREDCLAVRMRIDGRLRQTLTIPPDSKSAVIARVKVMAELDIAEHRIPQDGRSRFRLGGQEVDLRVSTMPTIWGEKAVIRLLHKSPSLLTPEGIGLTGDDLDKFHSLLALGSGMILITGPTGAGKSATMYTMIDALNTEEVNLITLEDPVEYNFPRVNQVPILEKTGMTFAAALRSVLRQDPDIIAVGEIRDAETADIALGAAITGHLVLSTLHCGDAPGAVDRLLDMGVAHYRIAAALKGVISQRLVRKLCPHCREAHLPESGILQALALGKDTVCYRGRGCDRCFGTGYRGRTAVFEILSLTPELRRAIAGGVSRSQFREMVLESGFSLLESSLRRLVESGVTSPEEALIALRSAAD